MQDDNRGGQWDKNKKGCGLNTVCGAEFLMTQNSQHAGVAGEKSIFS